MCLLSRELSQLKGPCRLSLLRRFSHLLELSLYLIFLRHSRHLLYEFIKTVAVSVLGFLRVCLFLQGLGMVSGTSVGAVAA